MVINHATTKSFLYRRSIKEGNVINKLLGRKPLPHIRFPIWKIYSKTVILFTNIRWTAYLLIVPVSAHATHQQSIHDESQYQCRDCEYYASTRGSLTTHHTISIHEGKEFLCRNVITTLFMKERSTVCLAGDVKN